MSRYLIEGKCPDAQSIPQDYEKVREDRRRNRQHLSGNRQGEAHTSSRDDFSFPPTHGVYRDGTHHKIDFNRSTARS
jgi:hypothetical protein